MVKATVKVPQIVEVEDYHDIEFLQEDYRRIVPGIKVKEIGFDQATGLYTGLVYLGTLKDSKNRKLLRDQEKHLQEGFDELNRAIEAEEY